MGTAVGIDDNFPVHSGPDTAVSYGVYPTFFDPYRLAPYGNVRFSTTGYPPNAEYAAWRAPRVGRSAKFKGCDYSGGSWPRSVPNGASASFQLTYPEIAYRSL
jgi:hypothetical protein